MREMQFDESIINFNKQLTYEPFVANAKALRRKKNFIVCGMGGSHLAADLIKAWNPDLPVMVWNDYGLPPLSHKRLKESLIIISSYSGNTEEVLDALSLARRRKLAVACIATAGKLLVSAKEHKLPHVHIPNRGLQPRMALGLSVKAMLLLMGEKKALAELATLGKKFRTADYAEHGKALAKKLFRRLPIIYSSERNAALANQWKIKLNETGKIPAFWNVFPELNHNEMTGFDVHHSTWELSKNAHFIFLKDSGDNRRIEKRMAITSKLLAARNFKIEMVPLWGKTRWEKIFYSVALSDWVAYSLARGYNTDPEQVVMVEELKKRMAK
jgi:glucose/mannose-6-phosphate isomerase